MIATNNNNNNAPINRMMTELMIIKQQGAADVAAADDDNDIHPHHHQQPHEPSSSLLPKESEQAERKRPLAIQELLEKKRARLAHNGTTTTTVATGTTTTTNLEGEQKGGEEARQQQIVGKKRRQHNKRKKETTANGMGKKGGKHDCGAGEGANSGNELAELVNHLCNREQDSETISSSGSTITGPNNGLTINGPSVEMPSSQSAIVMGQLLKKAIAAAAADPSPTSSSTSAFLIDPSAASLGAFSPLLYCNDPQKLLLAMQSTMKLQQQQQRQMEEQNACGNGIKNGGGSCGTPSPSKSSSASAAEINESPFSKSVPHDRMFAQVPGRLSLLSNVVKYKMSVGEVKRRLMGPESFNFSLLGALLRRAKMPEKSQMLVDELNQVGLSIPRGRRRLTQVTLLSALTEAESVQFANDFKKIAEAEFPSRQMAAELLLHHQQQQQQSHSFACTPMSNGTMENGRDESAAANNNNRDTFHARLAKLHAALKLTTEFMEMLDKDRSPILEKNERQILPPSVQEPFSTFSMLTHGFGNPAIHVGVHCFVEFLKHQIQMLEGSARTTNKRIANDT